MKILIIGSSGYFAESLIDFLYKKKLKLYGIDIKKNKIKKKIIKQSFFDASNFRKLEKFIVINKITHTIHLATLLDFAVKNQKNIYTNNVNIAETLDKVANKVKLKKIIFISSNSIFLETKKKIITNKTKPSPVDEYGKSKLKSEQIFHKKGNVYQSISIRSPNILNTNRIGMMSILFELVRRGNILWVVDNGKIKHQCVYSLDLINLIYIFLYQKKSLRVNLGSENVKNFNFMFTKLIKHAKSSSRILSLNKKFVIIALKILAFFKISPFGPYQIRMLTRNFLFDNTYAKKIGWKTTKNDCDIICDAYDFYIKEYNALATKKNKSHNSGLVNFRVLKILKYLY
jgi:nucleoside-diphosphate-sugar epimerase